MSVVINYTMSEYMNGFLQLVAEVSAKNVGYAIYNLNEQRSLFSRIFMNNLTCGSL